MEITIEELLKQMLNFFQNVDKELDNAREELSIADLKQQDLLHYIENHTLNAGGYSKVGKAIKQVRIERRQIKHEIEKLERIQRFTSKYNNKLITGDIIQILKDLGMIEKKYEAPIYNYKVLKELEDNGKQSDK